MLRRCATKCPVPQRLQSHECMEDGAGAVVAAWQWSHRRSQVGQASQRVDAAIKKPPDQAVFLWGAFTMMVGVLRRTVTA